MHKLKNFLKSFMPSSVWNILRRIKSFIKSIILGAITLPQSLALYFSREPDNFKYDIAIATIMKNEGAYLEEWIKYHLLVGIKKFYLYDNESTDNTKEVLKPYIERGIVDLIYFPGKGQQIPVYRDAVKRYKYDCRYIAFIDVDEFIRPMDQNKSVVDVVNEIFSLANRKRAAGLVIPRKTFGNSGYVKPPLTGGGTEQFYLLYS